MGKNKQNKLCNVKIPKDSEDKLPILPIEPKNGVVLGMTFIRLNGDYGLDVFCKHHKKISDRNVFEEFIELQNNVRTFKDMTQFLMEYSPHNGQPKRSEFQQQEVKRLKEKYGFEADEGYIKHIHAKPKGKGETVIWGYIYDNIFEVLAIDTKHQSI